MTDLHAIGQNEATFLYPAVTDAELADPDQVVVGYRRAMGRNRMLWAGIGAIAGLWLFDYVRSGRGAKRKTK